VHEAEVIFLSLLPHYVIPVAEVAMSAVPGPAEFQRAATATANRLLAAATVVADKAGVRSRTVVGTGVDDADCIFDEARQRRCGLIVVGSMGRNAVLRLLTGSVIPGLITVSTIPVLIVRERGAASKAATSDAVVRMPPGQRRARAPRVPAGSAKTR
jgi:nucleotide-binding universal stress UspA family protein